MSGRENLVRLSFEVVKSRRWLRQLVVLLPLALAVGTAGCAPSQVVVDVEQGRLDRAADLPQGPRTVGQTFVAHRPRLTAVEILAVAYDPQPEQPQSLVFHLRESPASTVDLATVRLDSHHLQHNDVQRFTFPPIEDSAGRPFYFFLEGSDGNRVTAWSSSVDVYGEGTMWAGGQEARGDLQFKTFHDEDVALVASDLAHGIVVGGWLVLPILALFLLPGLVALVVADRWRWPAGGQEEEAGRTEEGCGWSVERLAVAAGLSLALVPVGLLFTTTAGWRWDGPRFRFAVILLSIGGAWLAWRWRTTRARGQPSGDSWAPHSGWLATRRQALFYGLALVAVLAVSFALRYLQVRELVLPAWVDSLHHAVLAKLIADAGAIPPTYTPLGPDTPFLYHYGFHALVAGFAWLTALDIPRAELIVGQVVNAWTVLAMWLLATRLTGRPVAGLVAALIAGTVSTLPSYYVTWGRYTQLAGLVILPTAIVLTLDALAAVRRPGVAIVLAGLAVAGLFVTHYRVLLMYLTWLAAHLALESIGRRRAGRSVRQLWARAAIIGLTGGLIAAPWLARLMLGLAPAGGLSSWLSGGDALNAVPRSLIEMPRNRPLIVLAGLGWVLVGLARQRLALLVPLWVGLLLVVTNPRIAGLSSTWALSNASLVISLFVPISL